VDAVKRVLLISILLICMFAPMNAEAQFLPVGVELECDDETISIVVHPERNDPVSIVCTVTNTGTLSENIELDSTLDSNQFSLTLSESSFELEAGGDDTFVATFAASPRIDVVSVEYNITATIVSAGIEPILIPLGQLGSSAESTGEVSSLPYTKFEFKILGDSSRTIEEFDDDEDDAELIQLELFNDGNMVDEFEIIILNAEELKGNGLDYAFMNLDTFFVGIDSYRDQVEPGTTSSNGYMAIGVSEKNQPSEDISMDIQLRAYSTIEGDSEYIDQTITVVIKGSDSSGGVLGLSSVSNNDMAMIGMAAGGLFGVILLLVIISRLSKRTGKQKIAVKGAKKAAKSGRKALKAGRAQKAVVEDDNFDDDDDFDDDFDFDDI
jgi:hypothetical protein